MTNGLEMKKNIRFSEKTHFKNNLFQRHFHPKNIAVDMPTL
jgi:hypothetical protein